MPRYPSFLLKLPYSIYLSLSLYLSPSLPLSLSLSLSDRWRGSERARERERERKWEREREWKREKEGENDACWLLTDWLTEWMNEECLECGHAHPCKHKACPHSKCSLFSQSVSMHDYYINECVIMKITIKCWC